MSNLFERVIDGGKRAVGETVNTGAHLVGDGLDLVGLDSAAHAVDKWGDGVADSLGALVGELNLGQTDDPRELVHGNVGAIGEAAKHLHKFRTAFDETGSGLTRLDADHWKGQAGDAFRAKFGPQPGFWLLAADACGAAATALDSYAQTVEWAQQQARQAIDTYEAARKASQEARDAFNHQIDQYNDAVKHYNNAAATGSAPREPSFLDQVAAAHTDLTQGVAVGGLHLLGGVAKAGADTVKFARGLNPMNPYNLTHPAQYQDHVFSTAMGLTRTANHPTELVKSLAGSGWSSDPVEALGRVIFDTASGVATGGGSTAGVAAKRAAVNALEHSAERTVLGGADDFARRAAGNAARHPDIPLPAQASPPVRLEGFPDAAYQHAPEPAPAHVPEPSVPESPHIPEPEAPAHTPEPEAPAHEPEPAKPPESDVERAIRGQQEQTAIRDAERAQAQTAKVFDDAGAQAYAGWTWNRTAEGLPEIEKTALDNYTRGQGNRGQGATYDEINGGLRNLDGRKVPAGTPAMWMERAGSVASTERELLLGRNLQWRAVEVLPEGNRIHIFAEIL